MKIAINPRGKPPSKKAERIHFDSLFELAEFLDSDLGKDPRSVDGTHGKNHGRYGLCSAKSAGHDWDLNCGYKKAKEMAFEGWQEGLEDIRLFSEKLTASWPNAEVFNQADGIDFAMSDEGEEICVDAVLDGDDMHWRAPVFITDKPIIRIGVNIGALGSTDAEAMKARGMICGAMIQQIERMGFGVQLYAIHCSMEGGTGGDIIRSVKIKDSDEYVHDATIAFWVAHPAAIRRITFRLLECTPYSPARIGSGMGATQEFTSPDLDYITPSVHAMRQSGALKNADAMMEATIKMVEEIMEKQVQVVDQFATK